MAADIINTAVQNWEALLGLAGLGLALKYKGDAAVAQAKATAVPASQPVTTVYVPTPVAEPVTKPTTGLPGTAIYDPVLNGGVGPAFVPWERMRQMVAFRVGDETRKFLLAGIVSQADRDTILAQVAAAEATNEYRYTIHFSAGYYLMQAICSPIDSNRYKYQVVIESSGMNKQ
jgi:hypothetical protein